MKEFMNRLENIGKENTHTLELIEKVSRMDEAEYFTFTRCLDMADIRLLSELGYTFK